MDQFNQSLEASIDEIFKNRDALALRNRTLAEAIHQTPLRHRVRRIFLSFLAKTYIPPSRTAQRTQRILLIRPDHLGDVVMMTPAIRLLRETYPHREIHVLVGPWSAAVFENNDMVDMVLTLPFPGFTRGHSRNWRSPYRYAVQAARRLRRIGYAEAVILRPDHWWGAWLARLTGIPRRVGYAHVDTSKFLTDAIPHKHEHAARQNLRLIEATIGNPVTDATAIPLHFPITEVDSAFVKGYLSEWGTDQTQRYFVIHPGAGTTVKRWEAKKWASVADILSEQLNALVVFTGTDQEVPIIQEICAVMTRPHAIMAGDTTVGHLAAVLSQALVALGPDSGPLHIAVAVNTPTVALFGPADPIEFGPWGDTKKHAILTGDIACRPCRVLDWSHDDLRFHPCVREITVNEVLTAARVVARRDE